MTDASAQPQPKYAEPISERSFSGPGYQIEFQYGPVKEVGKNGCQIGDLLSVAVQRLRFLQEIHAGGKFACKENADALQHLVQAQACLSDRTKKREAQGVEGENKPHTS